MFYLVYVGNNAIFIQRASIASSFFNVVFKFLFILFKEKSKILHMVLILGIMLSFTFLSRRISKVSSSIQKMHFYIITLFIYKTGRFNPDYNNFFTKDENEFIDEYFNEIPKDYYDHNDIVELMTFAKREPMFFADEGLEKLAISLIKRNPMPLFRAKSEYF